MIHVAELLQQAQPMLNEVVGRIRDDQWSIRLPALLDVPGYDTPRSMRSAVAQLVRADTRIPDLLAGRTPTDPDGDPLGEDAHAAVVRQAELAGRAAGEVTDGDAVVHESGGDSTAADLLWRTVLARSFLAHDIAMNLGSRACPLPENLARPLWEGTADEAGRWRERGYFREPLTPVPDDVSWRDRFLMAAGRDPHPWSH